MSTNIQDEKSQITNHENQAQKKTSDQKGLGRGLSALFGDDFSNTNNKAMSIEAKENQSYNKNDTSLARRQPVHLPIESLKPNPTQPRKIFNEDMIDALASSIAQKGILQPILVRAKTNDSSGDASYEIIAGERRWRAAQRAKLHEVPVSILTLNDKETVEVALIENIHREALNALEEAEGYQQLIERYNYTQEAASRAVAKSRSHIANLLRLLSLPEEVKAMLQDGHITMGHARALLASKDAVKLAAKVVENKLTVRDVERMIQNEIHGKKSKHKTKTQKQDTTKITPPAEIDPNVRDLVNTLSNQLGVDVNISMSDNQESGILSINFLNLEQLDDIIAKLGT